MKKGGGQKDEAAHNWDNVVAKYRNRSAGKEVEAAFIRAGYASSLRSTILQAMRATGWHRSQIAHSLGGQNSDLRGGTDEDIQKCKNALIGWAHDHPHSTTGASTSTSKPRRKKKVIEEDEFDRDSFNIVQLGVWAKGGDRDALFSLARWAASGRQDALQKVIALGGIEFLFAHVAGFKQMSELRTWRQTNAYLWFEDDYLAYGNDFPPGVRIRLVERIRRDNSDAIAKAHT